jgi:hypothetical protein
MLDPVTTLYLSLLCTSATAAVAAREVRHHALARCYLANCLIYGLLGLCHWCYF